MKKRSIQWIAGFLSLLILAGCSGKSAIDAAPTAKAPAEESVPAASMEPISSGEGPETEAATEDHPFGSAGEEIPRSDGVHADMDYAGYIMQDFRQPMGVATYRTADEMDPEVLKALPPKEELIRLMQDNGSENLIKKN